MKTIDTAQAELSAERTEYLMKVGRKTNSKPSVKPTRQAYPLPRKSKKMN